MERMNMVSEEAIRAILMEDWDPISVRRFGVTDEYDSYIAEVQACLVQDSSIAAIAALLQEIASVRMLVDLPPRSHWNAAEKLRRLIVSRVTEH